MSKFLDVLACLIVTLGQTLCLLALAFLVSASVISVLAMVGHAVYTIAVSSSAPAESWICLIGLSVVAALAAYDWAKARTSADRTKR